ncbi:unnamed protein product [Gongylonema pulchrum]|uniref:ST5 n=1 Tax=Gongylonema pulchrum TaxID=637853 RepID=A0A183EQA0_9BILA|nr:unnamed protein product [Gongylonema pulchrum]
MRALKLSRDYAESLKMAVKKRKRESAAFFPSKASPSKEVQQHVAVNRDPPALIDSSSCVAPTESLTPSFLPSQETASETSESYYLDVAKPLTVSFFDELTIIAHGFFRP